MSKQETINFNAAYLNGKVRCDGAINSLCKIDKVLDKIHRTANTLINSEVKKYEEYLLNAKDQINKQLDRVKNTINNHLKNKSFSVRQLDTVNIEIANLVDLANNLTGSKLVVIEEMIDQNLLSAGEESVEKLSRQSKGVIDIPEDMLERINMLEDISLRELVYREALKKENANVTFDKILDIAKQNYENLLNDKTEKVIEEFKEELKQNGVSTEVLNNIKTIDEANKIVNDAITEETVRKETLKIIIKSIRNRGFIVDTKKNLKIDKEKNVVKLVAMKASGQTAEFEIQLNGQFMYRFDNYEGQACKKDIEPFFEDLENIYNIEITSRNIIWSNPDKIQTRKYQQVNKNKGTL